MKQYRFPSGYAIAASSPTEFLRLYAELNDALLSPDLVNASGGKDLLWIRAAFMLGVTDLPHNVSDEQFVAECEQRGIFTTEEWDGMEKPSAMQKARSKFVFWSKR